MSTIQAGDNGTLLNITIQDNKGVVDLRTATLVEVAIKFRGNPIVKTATITDSINGKVSVTLTNSDLQYDGIYIVQSTVTFQDSSKFTSDIQSLPVGKNLRM